MDWSGVGDSALKGQPLQILSDVTVEIFKVMKQIRKVIRETVVKPRIEVKKIGFGKIWKRRFLVILL